MNEFSGDHCLRFQWNSIRRETYSRNLFRARNASGSEAEERENATHNEKYLHLHSVQVIQHRISTDFTLR